MSSKTDPDGFTPWMVAYCELCGISYNAAKWPYQIQGLNICAGCNSRCAPVIHYIRFVRYLAGKGCDNVRYQAYNEETQTFDTFDGEANAHCRLDCKCIPCEARRVIRVHSTFMAKKLTP